MTSRGRSLPPRVTGVMLCIAKAARPGLHQDGTRLIGTPVGPCLLTELSKLVAPHATSRVVKSV